MSVWVEKYRPESLEEVVGQDTIVQTLSSYVEKGEIPNMIFSGPAGVGKTTCAHALTKELYDENWQNNFTELNASDDRGINIVRNQIKEFARTSPSQGAKHKIIFLDEADALCLPPGTKLVTGYPADPEIKNIEDVSKKGEKIPSVGFETNQLKSDEGKMVETGKAPFYKVKLEDGRKITASPRHPFFVVGEKNKLIEKQLQELKKGTEIADFKDKMKVYTPEIKTDGGRKDVDTVTVESIDYSHYGKAYNITMEETPNFILGNGVLTHNTRDAQPALRRTMELYSETCRFILSCNYSSNIIEPIQSRCAVFRFSPVDDESLKKRIRYIAKKEELDITEEALDALTYISQGDVRRSINSLQAASALDKKIDEDTIYKTTSTAREEEIKQIISKTLKGNFEEARKTLESLLNQGIGGGEILEQMYRVSRNSDELNNSEKIKLIDKIGETEYRIAKGSDEKIQLEALLASLSIESS